jgi:CubicO group peptidase (beta-lactamase class C family)
MRTAWQRVIVPVILALTSPAAARQPSLCALARAAIDAAAAATMVQGSPGMIVMVARDGRPLFARAYGSADLEQGTPMQVGAVFPLASITKMFTAAAILSLAEQGRLSVADPVAMHVPELPPLPGLKIGDLLVQTSGIPDFAADAAGEATAGVARSNADMLAWIARLATRPGFAPGTRWEYSNSNYVLLGLIAQRVAGKDLAALYAERLFGPAGLARTAFDNPADVVPGRVRGYRRDRSAASGFANAAWISPTVPGAAGGLRGSADDLARWLEALFGGRILQPQSLAAMIMPGRLRDGRNVRLGMPEAWQRGLQSDYGMGVFIRQTAAGVRIGHSGDINGFATWAAHYPFHGISIILMINSESADLPVNAVEAAVFDAAGVSCLGEPAPP